ncbi:hypothetical protein ACFOG5_16895 [Pedobacter fastidiosus]|uniref:hypothetical protein n=1 Tax=Pedobacter fastidiosus TaxID=2765361 RepID=UPI00361CE376
MDFNYSSFSNISCDYLCSHLLLQVKTKSFKYTQKTKADCFSLFFVKAVAEGFTIDSHPCQRHSHGAIISAKKNGIHSIWFILLGLVQLGLVSSECTYEVAEDF